MPVIIIAWDPEILPAQAYAELVVAVGDMARDAGAVGVERIAAALAPSPPSPPE